MRKYAQTRHEKMQKCPQTHPKNVRILHPIWYNLMQNGPFCTLSVIKSYTRTDIMLSFSIRIASFRQYLSKLFRANEYIFAVPTQTFAVCKLVWMLVCKLRSLYCVLRGSETNRILRTVDVIMDVIGMLYRDVMDVTS